jgi:hypothetical protein
MTTAQLADLVTGHLVEHGLPEPASLHLTVHAPDQQEARVQLRTATLAGTAAGLLAWAATQAAVRLEAWRPPSGTSVHLDVQTTLTGAHGAAIVVVYGGVSYDPAVFGVLEPGERCPVSLGQLTAWATSGGARVAA